jgi:hypothetical protein
MLQGPPTTTASSSTGLQITFTARARPCLASALLSLEAAWSRVSRIETEIASWIWEHPFEDYPPDSHQPQHADILHRVEVSHILARVPTHDDRRKLLDRFYRELEIDSHK